MYLHGRHGFTLAKAINYILKPLLVIGSNTVVDYFVLLQTSYNSVMQLFLLC